MQCTLYVAYDTFSIQYLVLSLAVISINLKYQSKYKNVYYFSENTEMYSELFCNS